MNKGFRYKRIFGSIYASETFNTIGLEIGFVTIPSLEGTVADTFSLVLKLSHFMLAIGYIITEAEL